MKNKTCKHKFIEAALMGLERKLQTTGLRHTFRMVGATDTLQHIYLAKWIESYKRQFHAAKQMSMISALEIA